MCENYFEVYDIPYRSSRYYDVKKRIENDLVRKPTFKENLICVDSVLKRECNQDIRNLFNTKFLKKLPLLEDDTTFVSDQNFKYIPRYIAEYDPGLYQLECCVFVYDEYDNVLLLQKNKSRSDGLTTMIQGHVSYSREIYTMNKSDFIKTNMIREIKEEVANFPKISIDDIKHFGYLYSCDNLIKMIHFGVLYKCKIPHSKMRNIITNEPKKHNVIIMNIEKLRSGEHRLNLDPWLQLLLKSYN